MDILRCSFASVCAWSPFRFSAMGKGRKKEALHIAKKLLVRLLTQCSRVGGRVAGALDEVRKAALYLGKRQK